MGGAHLRFHGLQGGAHIDEVRLCELLRHMAHVLEVGKAFNVPVGHPHMTKQNAQSIIDQGFRFLMSYPRRDFSALDAGRNVLKSKGQ